MVLVWLQPGDSAAGLQAATAVAWESGLLGEAPLGSNLRWPWGVCSLVTEGERWARGALALLTSSQTRCLWPSR